MESLQYVFRVQNALNPIEVLAVDRDAREVVLHDHVERSLESSLHLDGDDVRARHHDLADDGIAEFEDRVDHFLSVSSMLPSSCPTSAIDRMSCSETNGPCFRPLPGRSTLASPISRRAGRASARPSAHTMGAMESAARSL